MNNKEKLLRLIKGLYPDGRAYIIPTDTSIEKLHKGMIGNEEQGTFSGILLDINNLKDSLAPDNANFSEEDANIWCYWLGIHQTSGMTFEQKKAAILQKQSFPKAPDNMQHEDFINEQLLLAGFTDVYVFKNSFAWISGGEAVSPLALLEYYGITDKPLEPCICGGIYCGDTQVGTQGNDQNFSKLVNYIPEAKDIYFTVFPNYRNMFFVAKTITDSTFEVAQVPIMRAQEFRQLLLNLKSTQTGGYLFVEYVVDCVVPDSVEHYEYDSFTISGTCAPTPSIWQWQVDDGGGFMDIDGSTTFTDGVTITTFTGYNSNTLVINDFNRDMDGFTYRLKVVVSGVTSYSNIGNFIAYTYSSYVERYHDRLTMLGEVINVDYYGYLDTFVGVMSGLGNIPIAVYPILGTTATSQSVNLISMALANSGGGTSWTDAAFTNNPITDIIYNGNIYLLGVDFTHTITSNTITATTFTFVDAGVYNFGNSGTYGGTVTHSAGYMVMGAGGYMDTGYNPNIQLPLLSRHYSLYSVKTTNDSTNYSVMGANNSGGGRQPDEFQTPNATGWTFKMNWSGSNSGVTGATHGMTTYGLVGFALINSIGDGVCAMSNTTYEAYRNEYDNSITQHVYTHLSYCSKANTNIKLGKYETHDSRAELSFASFGDMLDETAGEVTTYAAAVIALQTSLGRNVF